MTDEPEENPVPDEPFDWDNPDQDYLSGETDVEPIYLGSVQFLPDSPGAVEGHVYTDPGSELPSSIDQLDLKPLAELLGLDHTAPAAELHFEPLPDDFDFDDPDVRGPFFDEESLENWLEGTGMFGNVVIYFDEINGEYWLQIQGTP